MRLGKNNVAGATTYTIFLIGNNCINDFVFYIFYRPQAKKRRKFECPKCQIHVYNLNRHLQKVHNEIGSYRSSYPAIIKNRKRESKVKFAGCFHHTHAFTFQQIYYDDYKIITVQRARWLPLLMLMMNIQMLMYLFCRLRDVSKNVQLVRGTCTDSITTSTVLCTKAILW